MNGFVIAPKANEIGNDAYGAFHVGANRFTKIHDMPKPVLFDNLKAGGKPEVVAQLFLDSVAAGPAGGWDVFAYFGHGETDQLVSARVGRRYGADKLAEAIALKANPKIKVLLFACNTGDPGGFASMLASAVATKDATVFAHVSPPGHSFMNPNVVSYPGGKFLIDPKNTTAWNNWNRRLHGGETTDDLFALFPFMDKDDLEAELAAPDGLLGRWRLSAGAAADSDVVFFKGGTAVWTSLAGRFLTVARGSWKVQAMNLIVTWDDGGADRWPLQLSRRGQNVYRTQDGQSHLRATWTEPPDHNPPSAFAGIARLIDL